MSRIRSIHPGLWTDENFVELSPDARLFLIGIWGEADDYGVFEWKPRRLKMRLAPVDNIDADDLLDQLQRFKQVVRLERDGRIFGVVRNFRLFQRPKNPSAPTIPLDREITDIIGLTKPGSPTPALPQPEPGPTEIPPQMEDVGDKDDDGDAPEAEHIFVTRKLLNILTVDWEDPRWFGSAARVQMWLKRGWSADSLIFPAAQKLMATRAAQGPPNNINYVEKVVASYAAELSRPLPEITNVNGARQAKPRKQSLDDQFDELDQLCGERPVPMEPFPEVAGGIVLDNPAQRH